MSANPSYVEPIGVSIPGDDGPVSSSRRLLKVSKTMMAGFGCAVAAIAFAGGYYVGPGDSSSAATESDADTAGGDGGAGDTDAAMEASLDDMVLVNPLLRNLTSENMDGIINEYLADPAAYEDAFIPKEFAALMSKIAVQEGFVAGENEPAEPAGDRRRLGANQPALEAYRELSPASQLSKDAWTRIQSDYYPDPVRWSEDMATVYKSGSRCWIIAKETDSARGWLNNLDLGKEDVWSFKRYSRRDSRCGCEVKKWWQWWCQKHRQCNVNIKLGRASDASGKPYNQMRGGIMQRINQRCSGASDYVFAGYSRGGGIASVIAFAIWKEKLLEPELIKLVTFGT